MGATFTRIKNWVKETLNHEDLNKEIDNILENLDPQGVGDYSENAAQMKLVTDPGTEGSESLPTSLAGEIERLRFMVQQITGETPWYASVGTNLKEVSNFIAAQTTSDRIISARTTGNSPRAKFLIPGGDDSVTLKASPEEPFVYSIGGNTYTLTDDVVYSGLLGTVETPIGKVVLPDGGGYTITPAEEEKYLGVGGYGLIIKADDNDALMKLVNYRGVFTLTEGANTEYVMTPLFGRAASDTYAIPGLTDHIAITGLNRKVGVLPNGNPTGQVTVEIDSELRGITTRYMFLDAAGVLHAGVGLSRSLTQPSAVVPNVYWQNPTNLAWFRSNGSTWESAAVVYVGLCAVNTSNECVMAHSADIATARVSSSPGCIRLTGDIQVTMTVNSRFSFGNTVFNAGATQTLSRNMGETKYFLYLKPDGSLTNVAVAPHDLRDTLGGWFHPDEQWLCVGFPNLHNTIVSLLTAPIELSAKDFFHVDDEVTGNIKLNTGGLDALSGYALLDALLTPAASAPLRGDIHARLITTGYAITEVGGDRAFSTTTFFFGFDPGDVPRGIRALSFDTTLPISGSSVTNQPVNPPPAVLKGNGSGTVAGGYIVDGNTLALNEIQVTTSANSGVYALSSRWGSTTYRTSEVNSPHPASLVTKAYIRI